MRNIALLLLAMLAGCSTFEPGISSFPDAPPKLMDKPKELVTIKPVVKPTMPTEAELRDVTPSDVKLSELVKTIIKNYGTCVQNEEQVSALQRWISEQKKLSEKYSNQ